MYSCMFPRTSLKTSHKYVMLLINKLHMIYTTQNTHNYIEMMPAHHNLTYQLIFSIIYQSPFEHSNNKRNINIFYLLKCYCVSYNCVWSVIVLCFCVFDPYMWRRRYVLIIYGVWRGAAVCPPSYVIIIKFYTERN